jgi:hypothetical protein
MLGGYRNVGNRFWRKGSGGMRTRGEEGDKKIS